jgi:short-subunit dehydrogenase
VQLSGSVIVVTGAGRGIGAATARALTARGAHVVGVGRGTAPAGTQWIRSDLRDPAAGEQVIAGVLDRHGRVDAVVANAGVGHAGPMADMPVDRIVDLVAVNLTAPLLLTRAVLPTMRAAGRGNLLYLSSIAGAVGVPGEAVYSATKAAVESFADTLRQELHGSGLTVATLLPGVVATDFHVGRGVPYERRFPRPLRADRVAAEIVDMLERNASRRIVPRWLAGPAAIRATAPRLYRALERRLG